MTITEIRFKNNPTTFLGRNGAFKCIGIEIWNDDLFGEINIYPITSKGNTARCRIAIPIGEMDNFIDALKKVTDK